MNRIIIVLSVSLLITNTHFAQDVEFSWAKQIGGSGPDEGYSIAVDNSGHIYTIGTFKNTINFETDQGTLKFIANNQDIFLTKHTNEGALVWVKQFKGNKISKAFYVTVDVDENILVSGYFNGTIDLDPHFASTYYIHNHGEGNGVMNEDGFICKLDRTGNFIWARQFKGDLLSVEIKSLVVDSMNYIYASGQFSGNLLIQYGVDTFKLTALDKNDVFILKMDTSGSIKWLKQIKSNNFMYNHFIVQDSEKNLYISGIFSWTADFDPGENPEDTFYLTSYRGMDNYVCKLDSSGRLIWAKKLADPSHELYNYSMDTDSDDNLYIAGHFKGAVDFNMSSDVNDTFFLRSNNLNTFICKLNPKGEFVWAKQFTGQKDNLATSVKLGKNEDIYLTGRFESRMDCDPGPDTFYLSSSTNLYSTYICKLDSAGNYLWAKGIPDGSSSGRSITTDDHGNAFITGTFGGSVDFDPGIYHFFLSTNNSDAFILKLAAVTIGFNDHINNQNIVIYPNPSTSGLFKIDLQENFTNLNAIIRNIHGQVINTKRYASSDQLQLQINGSAGIYFVELRTDDGKAANLKLIKL